MDVSMRLRLQYQSRDAKEAERDIKDIKREFDKLGRANGADKLDRNLKDVGREAKNSKRAIGELEQKAKELSRVKTDNLDKELRETGKAAKRLAKDFEAAREKLHGLQNLKGARNLSEMEAPAGRLNSTLGMIAGSAAGAMAGLMAFASVDNIVRGLEQMADKFRDLNREVASVAVTAEMRTPEAIAKISKSNETLSIRYGQGQTDVNEARKAYAAAGIDLASQESILDPTLKAAKAEDSDGETIASAMIAAKQALGVKDTEIPAALDMMAKGAKLGSFEVDAMAKNFPALGTMMAGTGRNGLQGWAELVALSQVVRMGAGSQDEAARNLQNLLAKLTSRDTVKNFDDAGVDLSKLKAKAEKEGKPYLTAVMDKVMELTGGDQFKIGELFGDQQAGLALKPLLTKRDVYESFLKQILSESGGTVDADFNFLRNLPKEKADRRGAAMEATGASIGEAYDAFTSPGKDRFARWINSDYDRQRRSEELPNELAARGFQRLKLENQLLELQNAPKDSNPFGPDIASQIQATKEAIAAILEEERALVEEMSKLREAAPKPQAPESNDLGKSTGEIPIPTPRPLEQSLGKTMAPAAEQAMQGYNERLSAEGDKAVAIATEKASQMQKALNFTATPTIVPQVVAPPATGEQHSSLQSNTGVKLTQHISSPNPRQAARLAARNQARAIRQAQANSFHDVGRRIT